MPSPADFSEATDPELITAILEGSARAVRGLDTRYRDRVFTRINRIVHDRETAEDLTQETLLKAFEELASFNPDRPFWPWISEIAKNKALDHVRKKESDARAREAWLYETTPGKRLREGVPSIHQEPSDPIRGYAIALYQEYLQAIEQLKEPYRQLYIWRDIQKRSYDDLAKELTVPAGTLRSYVTRARRQLQMILTPLLDLSPTPP